MLENHCPPCSLHAQLWTRCINGLTWYTATSYINGLSHKYDLQPSSQLQECNPTQCCLAVSPNGLNQISHPENVNRIEMHVISVTSWNAWKLISENQFGNSAHMCNFQMFQILRLLYLTLNQFKLRESIRMTTPGKNFKALTSHYSIITLKSIFTFFTGWICYLTFCFGAHVFLWYSSTGLWEYWQACLLKKKSQCLYFLSQKSDSAVIL